MQSLFLPFETSFDDASQSYCCVGVDRFGKPFGAGSGATVEEAVARLREALFDSLLADAADGNDSSFSLFRSQQGDACLPLSVCDLLPVRIRLARAARRLNQGEVAARMGISQQAYSRLERPGSNPTIGMLARLEDALQQELLTLA